MVETTMTQNEHTDRFNNIRIYFPKVMGVFGDIIFHTEVLPTPGPRICHCLRDIHRQNLQDNDFDL